MVLVPLRCAYARASPETPFPGAVQGFGREEEGEREEDRCRGRALLRGRVVGRGAA